MKFRKKPVVIDAERWDGSNIVAAQIIEWAGNGRVIMSMAHDWIKIETLEGVMLANIGDWIIRGVAGEIYPCKPDIFDKTYERV